MSGTESLLSVVIAHAETTLKNKGSSIVVEKGQIVNVTKDKNGIENEWQSFRTKKDRSLELKSVFHECTPGRRKVAVKVVDIFGNDTMTIIEVTV